ncbi:MAG: hypothetical protein ACRDI1_07620, partial [Actinomycetota bacterium]
MVGVISGLALLLSACAGPTRIGAGSISHPSGADVSIVRIEDVGGFAPATSSLAGHPFALLLGDGRVVTVGPQMEIYPGPAMATFFSRKVSQEGIQAILQKAEEAGLTSGDRDFPNDRVADAPTTVFAVAADGRTSVVRANALEFEGETGEREK